MPEERVPDDAAGLRAANSRLRGLLADRDEEVAALRAGLDAERELRRRLELRLAELGARGPWDGQHGLGDAIEGRMGQGRGAAAGIGAGTAEGPQAGRPAPREGPGPGPGPGREGNTGRCTLRGLDGAQAVAEPGWAQVMNMGDRQEGDRVRHAGPGVPVLRACIRGPAARGARGCLRGGVDAAAVLLTSFGCPSARRGHGPSLRGGGLGGLGGQGQLPAVRAAGRARPRDAGGIASEALAADETPVRVLRRPAAPGAEEGDRDPEEKDKAAASTRTC